MSELKIKLAVKKLIPKFYAELEDELNWELLENYFHFLKKENERGGFFSRKDSERILDRHILDSLVFCWKLKQSGFVSRETVVADIGTGPGLPGFLFMVWKTAPFLYLVDSQKRKLALLESEVRDGSLDAVSERIEFVYARAEELEAEFDLICTRAMVPYPYVAEVATLLVKQNGYLCPFLAQEFPDKLVEKEVLMNNGFILKKEIPIPELDFVGKRHIKILQKTSKPRLGFPREWKEIVKETKSKNG
ncbi:MAG: class I SAM-dependent methyltransferase [Leptospira sp.]|nr:class I SAM-dependent methyltransferase [Leptospira sp.]